MKVIFLDFDGVLNSEEFFIARPHTPEAKKQWTEESDIDKHTIGLLNKITDATGAKIVVSSAWRVGRTVDWLSDFLKSVGATGEVIDRTESFSNERYDEIKKWVSAHSEIEKFIIIDDEFNMKDFTDRFVKTSWATGMTDYHVQKAIDLLR